MSCDGGQYDDGGGYGGGYGGCGGAAASSGGMEPGIAHGSAGSIAARSWRPLAVKGGAVPGKRSGAASVMVGSKLYIFGGYGGSGRLDDFHVFDLEEKCWTCIESRGEAPGARENNGLVEWNGCLYLFGG